MIGIIGDSNTGKSTLINALIGQRLLPQSHKCCTSLFARVTLVNTEVPRMKITQNQCLPAEHCEGRREIQKRLSELNQMRRQTSPVGHRVSSIDELGLEVALHSRGCPRICDAGACDGTLTLADMPGQDEADGPIAQGCLDEFLSQCHAVVMLIRYDRLRSTTLVALLDRIAAHSPHLLLTPGAVTLVITQVDTLRYDGNDFENAEADSSVPGHLLEELKQDLRNFLYGRDNLGDFPGFVRDVQILATSIDERLRGGHEFPALLDVIVQLHARAKVLQRARRVRLCEAVYANFCDDLLDARPRFPARAEKVLAVQVHKEELDTALTTISAIATLVAIPLGGGVAVSIGCATRVVLAGVSLGLGLATSAFTASNLTQVLVDSLASPREPVLSGSVAEAVEAKAHGSLLGAIGAHEANRLIKFQSTANDILQGQGYSDTLLFSTGTPLYIGHFRRDLPQGPGRLFWPSTGYEAFIGDFDSGLPSRGIFLDERGIVIGHMRVARSGRLEEVTACADVLGGTDDLCRL